MTIPKDLLTEEEFKEIIENSSPSVFPREPEMTCLVHRGTCPACHEELYALSTRLEQAVQVIDKLRAIEVQNASLLARAEKAEAALAKFGGPIPAWIEEIRDAALEEAAQICDALEKKYRPLEASTDVSRTADMLAEDIRALKSSKDGAP